MPPIPIRNERRRRARRLCAAIAIVLFAAALPAGATAFANGLAPASTVAPSSDGNAQSDDIASGTSGTCAWVVDANGRLTVSPIDGVKGELEAWNNLAHAYFPPWFTDLEKTVVSQIRSVRFTGTVKTPTCTNMFLDCRKLEDVDLTGLDVSEVTSLYCMFDNCESLEHVNLGPLATTNVKVLTQMFFNCKSLKSVSFAGADFSNVQFLDSLFANCTSLETIDMSDMRFTNIMSTESMFHSCTSLTSVKLPDLSNSPLTDASEMFRRCSSLSEINLEKLPTKNLENTSGMFAGCASLASLDLAKFNTNNVTNMNAMFENCAKLEYLDLSGFETENVGNMGGMFADCTALSKIYVGLGWSTANVKTGVNMFAGCWSLVGDNGTAFDAAHPDSLRACIDTAVPGYLSLKASISGADVQLAARSVTYSAKPITQEVTVMLGDLRLVEGTHYSLAYENNENVGTATIRVSSRGSCWGATSTTFAIEPADISMCNVALSRTKFTYNGKMQVPDISVSLNGRSMPAGTCYAATWPSSSKAARSYTVKLVGKGQLKGSVSKTYKITKAPLSSVKLKLSKTSYEYTGKAAKPSVIATMGNGKRVSSSDLTVSYQAGRKNVGTYKVTVKGKRNLTGSIVKTFEVKPKRTRVIALASKKKNSVDVKWKKVSKQIDGYQVALSASHGFESAVSEEHLLAKGKSQVTVNIAKATYLLGKRVYVRMRTYQKANGKTHYSAWSNVKSVVVGKG